MKNLQFYNKAIVAFFALVAAILNANGFDIPDETIEQVTSAVIVLVGTFAVYWIGNKEPDDDNKI